jgi:hypothetical protein
MPITLDVSKRGQVLEDLCEAIRDIRVANGYHFDFAEGSVLTDPVNLLSIEQARRPLCQVEPSPTGSREFEPANQLKEFFRVLLTVVFDAEDSGQPDRKTAAAETMLADLEHALTRDVERGGVCSDTRVLVPEILASLGRDSTVIVVQEIECRIHREHGAP